MGISRSWKRNSMFAAAGAFGVLVAAHAFGLSSAVKAPVNVTAFNPFAPKAPVSLTTTTKKPTKVTTVTTSPDVTPVLSPVLGSTGDALRLPLIVRPGPVVIGPPRGPTLSPTPTGPTWRPPVRDPFRP